VGIGVSVTLVQEQPSTYSAYDLGRNYLNMMLELESCDWGSFNIFSTIMWVNALILYAINNNELLFKLFITFKCYSFNHTTTMTSRNRDRWQKYNSGAEKKCSKSEMFTDGDCHVVNGVEPLPDLRVLQYVKSPDGSFLNTEITYRIMLTVPVSYVDFSKVNLKLNKN
jgi:hypothetical protein